MLQRVHTGFITALAAGVFLAATSWVSAQQAPATGAAPAAAAPAPLSPAVLKQVVATVNGTPITRGELINLLERVPLPPADQEQTYQLGIQIIANNMLIKQFLTRGRIAVTDAEMNAKIAEIENDIKSKQGRDLKTVLAEANSSIEDLKKQIAPQLGWDKYINAVATDAALKKFADDNKDMFSRATVKASHILIAVPEDATPAVKEAAKKKLLAIKAEIDGGKITFADAANKYSEDTANKTSPNGGDLGYFVRKGQFIERFAATAFSMQKGQISAPLETDYGLHLIFVTDRKPGQPFDFEANKAAVLNQYKADLEERVIASERKTAKIEVKPMPADFFPAPANAPAAAPAAKGASAGTAAPK